MTTVRVGCSGWNYRDWKGDFYPGDLPANRWLKAYAEQFDTVEVNTPSTAWPAPCGGAVGAADTGGLRVHGHGRPLHDPHEAAAGLGAGDPEVLRAAGAPGAGRPPGPGGVAAAGQLPARRQRLDGALDLLPPGGHAFEGAASQPDHCRGPRPPARAQGGTGRRRPYPDQPFQSHELAAGWDCALVRMLRWGRRGRRGNYCTSEIETWAPPPGAVAAPRGASTCTSTTTREGFAPRDALSLAGRLTP